MAVPGLTAPLRTSAWTYFALVLGWSAAFWLLSARLQPGTPPEESLVFLIGGAGPVLSAIALTHLRESAQAQRDFWRRIVDPRLMGVRWFAVALLVHPLIVASAVALDQVLGADAPQLRLPSGGLLAWASLLFFTFWFGPLPEEIGWRGYALDRLQQRVSALGASLILGTVWACWHLPLFAVPGTFQHGIGFTSARFWIFSASMVPLSVLMTWVYNNSRRSTLSAALVHLSGNVCGVLILKTTRLAAVELLLLVVAAIVVVAVYGPRRLVREP